MKILLINPPKEKEFSLFVLDDYSTKARSNQVPLGLLYLHSYLKNKHDIEILDMNALEMSIMSVEDEIDRFKPDLIGITCVIAKWITVKNLARFIKQNFKIPIVVGGVNPSLYPYETLQCYDIDYVISGFGQEPLRKLCHSIEMEQLADDIPNIYTRKNCDKNTVGSFDFVNIDDFPAPDRGLLPINDYIMPFAPENPCTSMITSLGCPYSCHFCACKNFRPVKLRKTENIIEEMKNIESIGIKSILFNDELFTMNIDRIQNICNAIMDNNIKLNWSVRSRANLIHYESLELMKKAGCFNIHLGIESGTSRILSLMKKGITVEVIKRSVAMIKKAGLKVTASFMIGYPDETEEEILQTIQLAQDLKLNAVQFYITQPEPNTELYDECNIPYDIYSKFTLNPDSVDLKQNIASNTFTKEELESFITLAYSKTNNLYKIKENNQ